MGNTKTSRLMVVTDLEEWRDAYRLKYPGKSDHIIGTVAVYNEVVTDQKGNAVGLIQVDAIILALRDPDGNPDDGSVIFTIGVETSAPDVFAVMEEVRCKTGYDSRTNDPTKEVLQLVQNDYWLEIDELIDKLEVKKVKPKLTLVKNDEPPHDG